MIRCVRASGRRITSIICAGILVIAFLRVALSAEAFDAVRFQGTGIPVVTRYIVLLKANGTMVGRGITKSHLTGGNQGDLVLTILMGHALPGIRTGAIIPPGFGTLSICGYRIRQTGIIAFGRGTSAAG